jgi:hypothetical protein
VHDPGRDPGVRDLVERPVLELPVHGRRWRGAASYDNEHYVWFYGHGADRPDRDGYVRGEHLAC